MTAILGIHGVGNNRPRLSDQEAAADLSLIWTKALNEGMPTPLPIDLQVAYYAPQLRSEIAQGPDDPDALDPQVQDMIWSWIGMLDPPDEVAAGRITAPLRHALEWVAERFGLDYTLTRIFTTVFFREVATYFNPDNTYPRIRSRNVFLEAIVAQRPRIVIAHSLGSVVVYEALWARPDLRVDLLLTVGSPLGMPDVVFAQLDPSTSASGWGQRPPGVTTWINISDAGDLIAIPRALSQRFQGISSDLGTSIHAFDFHKVVNYLKNPTTIEALTPYLT